MRKADLVAGALLFLCALAFSAGALKYYAWSGDTGPGPAFLPFWLGLGMACLAFSLFVRTLKTAKSSDRWLPRGQAARRVLIVIAATVAFVALLKVLGMVIGSALYLALLMRVLERNPWPLTVGVSGGAALLNYLVFVHWLHVPFPEGLLGF